MRRLVMLVVSANTFVAAEAFARDVELGELLITAGRTPVEKERSGRAFTVITGEQLEASQTRYVADALRQVPGFHVSRTGSFGGLTQVRVRGAEGNHLLVFIDGVEVSSASDGEFDFGSLQAANIDRIEILRGPQGAVWGANALAGVVNIITKGGIRNGYEVSARSEAGTDETLLGSGSIRWGGERFDAALSASGRRTNGFNVSDFGTEDDGDENTTLNGKGTVDITDTFQVNWTGRYVQRASGFDEQDFAFPATVTQGRVIDTDSVIETRETFGSLGGRWTMLDGLLTHRFGVKASDTERDNLRDGVVTSASGGDRVNLYHQTTLAFETPQLAQSAHKITGGVEYERERFNRRQPVFDPSQLEGQERAIHGVVAEYRGAFFEQLFLNAAVRHDDNDAFEDATTYSVSGAFLIPTTGTRFHASAGTAVTNPTFFEQFGFIPAQFTGNPSLEPESSFGWDAGVEQSFFGDRLVIDVTYFQQDLQDEIRTDFVNGALSPVNLDGTSEREGVEVAATLSLFDGFSATGAYTYVDATEPDGADEVRRPRHTASLNMVYRFLDDRAELFADIIYNGDMEDLEFINATPETRVTLDEYTVVTIGGSYKLNGNVSLFGRVENLFDEEYEEVFDYNTQGITAFLGLKATLGGSIYDAGN